MDLGPSLAPPTVLSFDGNISDAWTIWKQEFLLYLDATETSSKPDKVKSSILLSCIGKRGREIYNTFTFAEGDNMKTSKIPEQFDQYCLPQKNLTFLRPISSTFANRKSHAIYCLKFRCECPFIAGERSQCDFELFAMFEFFQTSACEQKSRIESNQSEAGINIQFSTNKRKWRWQRRLSGLLN